MAGGKHTEMGSVLPCGRISKKQIPSVGKTQPLPPNKKPKNYALKVSVTSGGKKVSGAKVTVSGATVVSDKSGVSKFGKKPEGAYAITVGFGADSDYVDISTAINFDLSSDTNKAVNVELKNIVSAKIETEYDVVVLDRKINAFQESTETKIETDDVCLIQVSFQQSNKAFPYAKTAKLECTGGGKVDLFTDPKCTVPFDGTIKTNQITSEAQSSYYLKAKTTGKFKLAVTLEDPGDVKVKLKEAKVEQPMGVAEIKGRLFTNDIASIKGKKVNQDQQPITKYYKALKDLKLPDQIEMSDSDKVKKGRFLHVQKDDSHARAKYILKIDPGQWEATCDGYQLYFAYTGLSGGVQVFDAETKGNKIDLSKPTLISDLKSSNGEKVFWIEGNADTKKKLDLVFGITLNRPAKGLGNKAKKNADWARFTILKIDKVAVKYDKVAGQPEAWDEGGGKFYINFKSDPDGRKVKILAKLSQKIEGVPICFMLAPDKDNGTLPTLTAGAWSQKNYKTKDVPGTHEWDWSKLGEALKQKDKTNRDDYFHLSKETNAEGEAEMELLLPRSAGEKFTPACYIQDDPLLAKYIDGDTDLEKLKPILAKKSIEVSRKFWYEIVEVEGVTPRTFDGAVGIYEHTKAIMEKAPNVKVTRTTVNGIVPQAIYPFYMVKLNGGNGDALVISDSNKGQFFAGCAAETEKPIKVPILICDAQWDPGGATTQLSFDKIDASKFPANVTTDKLMIIPCLQGGALVVSGSYKAAEWDPAAKAGAGGWVNVRRGVFTDADFSIDPNRTSLRDVKVALPAGVAPVAGTKVWIKFVLNGANGPYLGEYSRATKKILAVYDPKEPVDFQNTIAHELGHAFSQVKSDYSGGLPSQEWQYVHQGSHCRYKNGKTCLMYQSGPIADSLNRYCPDCHPYVLIEDMNKLA